MSSVLPSTGNATDSSEDTKIWRPVATSDGSGAPFSRNPPPSTTQSRNSVLGIAHPLPLRCAATVGCAAGFSYNGIHKSYRCGGLLRSVSVLWRDRKLDDAQMPKEVTRKTYFRHSAGQSSSLLVSFGNQRSRGKHTGSKRTTRHARARPPLRTPTLRYTSESRHLCQRTFEDSHTSHLIPHTMPHNALYLPLLWFYSQERQQKDRHRISQVGISDKRLAITPNQVGRHTERYRLVMCLSPIGAVSERVGHQVIVFGGGRCWRCPCGLGSCVLGLPSVTLTGRFSRMPPAEKKSSTKERDATIRHGFGRF